MVKSPKDTQSSAVFVAPQEEDGALLFRAKNGDTEATHTLIERHTPLVKMLASSFTEVPESERDDLVQEGLIALHKAILFYDKALSSFSTFAFHCVRHGMLDMLKKMNRRVNTVPFDSLNKEAVSESCDPVSLTIDRENCEAWLSRFDEVLSAYENRVLGLILSGKSPAQAALLLEKSEKSVTNALSRARAKLSTLLS